MATEKYIHGKHDKGRHEGKRSELLRIAEANEEVVLYKRGDEKAEPIARERVGNMGIDSHHLHQRVDNLCNNNGIWLTTGKKSSTTK